jgi:DNA-binding FadR family transcriptional regulator
VGRPDAYRGIANAIRAADPAAAERAARDLLGPATVALLTALDDLAVTP